MGGTHIPPWVLWLVILTGLLAVGYAFIWFQIANNLRHDQDFELGRVDKVNADALYALKKSRLEVVAPPCSQEFLTQLKRVSFLPDGLNEFFYAPSDNVLCSTTNPKFESPVPLGPADIRDAASGLALWLEKDLTPFGRPGSKGTILKNGEFAVAIPPHAGLQNTAGWLKKELVAVSSQGQVWNLAGEPGVFARRAGDTAFELSDLLTPGEVKCDQNTVYCIASEADLLSWAGEWKVILLSVIILVAVFAWLCATALKAAIARYSSFDARFLRYLDVNTLVIAYQPIVDLRSGEISGCEVLARWRDLDGAIVFPDRFIDLVKKSGRTLPFTRSVVELAYKELSARVPQGQTLQVNFNIFPCDLDSRALLPILHCFLRKDDRFSVAVEIVETDEIDVSKAEPAIRDLRLAGIKTYIDDFGTGFSSIERIATVSVDGVKLDRSFAMAPSQSILGRMFVQVLELIKASGRVIVVEGVETESKLSTLRASGLADFAQGYGIARPLSIDGFIDLLSMPA
ncbi:MAG: EAL domain-containing protein [Hyphomicrobium sp.]|jgi:sensor c-di-GMP phosphodiesterase-like protein